MPKVAKTKELIERLHKLLRSYGQDPRESHVPYNTSEYLSLLQKRGWGKDLTRNDVSRMLESTDEGETADIGGMIRREGILLPDDVTTYRGLFDTPSFKEVVPFAQATSMDPKVPAEFYLHNFKGGPKSILATILPSENNFVVPNPFTGQDELIIPPKRRLEVVDKDKRGVQVIRTKKAKGGKASTLDAVAQYVKNKLPQTGFFSTLDELIANAPFEKAPIEQWKNYLQPGRTFEREGVRFPLKKEELDYSWPPAENYAQLTEGTGIPLDKDELRAWIRRTRPDFGLKVGVPLPGKSDYNHAIIKATDERFPAEVELGKERRIPDLTQANYGEYAHGFPEAPYEESATRSPDFGLYDTHFGPNVLSHSRTTIQKHAASQDHGQPLPTGQRLMRLIEEIQSDRHQAAAEIDRPGTTIRGQNVPAIRRGYRTPAEEQEYSNPALVRERREAISRKVPDAPFKDPADYATLELKNQMLNAAKQGHDYLGLVRGSDVSDRFSHDPEARAGTAYTYDKVYQSALKKLANQYGIEIRDIPTTLKSSMDVATPTMREHNLETAGDVLDRAEATFIDAPHPEDTELGMTLLADVIKEMEGVNPQGAERARLSLDNFYREFQGALETNPFRNNRGVRKWWNQLNDNLGTLHEEYANKIRTEKGPQTTTKAFPSMVLLPEIREKILKAGVPIWGLSAMTAGTLAGLGANEEPSGFADGGIARLRQLAENVGTEDTIDRRKRILSGLASQLYGVNPDTGNIEFLGGASLLPKIRSIDEYRERQRQAAEGTLHEPSPGLVDEIQSMFLGTRGSSLADERLAELKQRIRGEMNVAEPHGFSQEFDEALGTMLGQLPVPVSSSKAKLVAKLPLVQRLRQLVTDPEVIKRLAKDTVKSLPEWFTPYVHPTPGNYLTGAVVGGGIGAGLDALEDNENSRKLGEHFADTWAEKHPDVGLQMAEGGKVEGTKPLHDMMSMLKSRLAELSNGIPSLSAPGDNAGTGYEELQMKAKGGKIRGIRGVVEGLLKSPEEAPKLPRGAFDEDLRRFNELIDADDFSDPDGDSLYDRHGELLERIAREGDPRDFFLGAKEASWDRPSAWGLYQSVHKLPPPELGDEFGDELSMRELIPEEIEYLERIFGKGKVPEELLNDDWDT